MMIKIKELKNYTYMKLNNEKNNFKNGLTKSFVAHESLNKITVLYTFKSTIYNNKINNKKGINK